jgi:hypothetical protein
MDDLLTCGGPVRLERKRAIQGEARNLEGYKFLSE